VILELALLSYGKQIVCSSSMKRLLAAESMPDHSAASVHRWLRNTWLEKTDLDRANFLVILNRLQSLCTLTPAVASETYYADREHGKTPWLGTDSGNNIMVIGTGSIMRDAGSCKPKIIQSTGTVQFVVYEINERAVCARRHRILPRVVR